MPGTRYHIDELREWLEIRFARATGPGGQHVNKVSTRAELLFDYEACTILNTIQKQLIRARLTRRLTRDGRLRIVAQQFRTQIRNRQDAEERLMELLAQALHVPPHRRPTRPTAASRRRRLTTKRQRGEIKRLRQQRPPEDE
ncbi:MAG: alternative ribosome rescue aminoacyl-tRNA hydrolase ArfB [Planctomycetota bacterium]